MVTVTLTFDLDSGLISVRQPHFRVRSISPTYFEVGIQNLVCGCILGLSVSRIPFWGHCDHALDLKTRF